MHHRETSYALLTFLTLAVGVMLASVTWTAQADLRSSLCGEQGNACVPNAYAVSAVVPGPRPSRPAVITSPSSGQSFSTNPVTVAGACPAGSLVKIFTNGILVGSVICDAGGHFSVPVDLVIGTNALTALPFNTLDQAGPTSPTVIVTLTSPAGGPGFSTELIIQSQNFYRGVEPGQEITWPIDIIGGQAPYAVSIDWGDGTSDLITRLAPGPFTVTHTYKKVGGYLGAYPLIIRATDAAGHTAYLQLTTIVNSAIAGTSNAQTPAPQINKLLIIWPLWIVLLLMVVSFWLGERREKRVMEKRLEALA